MQSKNKFYYTNLKSKILFLNFGISIAPLLHCGDNVKYEPLSKYFFKRT